MSDIDDLVLREYDNDPSLYQQLEAMRPRPAKLMAEAVAVLCPWCGDPQPNRYDGSHLWTKEDFHETRPLPDQCCNCDKPILIKDGTKAQFV